jgi:hypothetical protein
LLQPELEPATDDFWGERAVNSTRGGWIWTEVSPKLMVFTVSVLALETNDVTRDSLATDSLKSFDTVEETKFAISSAIPLLIGKVIRATQLNVRHPDSLRAEDERSLRITG